MSAASHDVALPVGATSRRSTVDHLAKPSDFAAKHELLGRGQEPGSGIYGMGAVSLDGWQEQESNDPIEEARPDSGAGTPLVPWRVAVQCKACGQWLTDPDSVARGIGPKCRRRNG